MVGAARDAELPADLRSTSGGPLLGKTHLLDPTCQFRLARGPLSPGELDHPPQPVQIETKLA